MSSTGERPGPAVASRNITFVGHSDRGGFADGVQLMVHRGHAYVLILPNLRDIIRN